MSEAEARQKAAMIIRAIDETTTIPGLRAELYRMLGEFVYRYLKGFFANG